MNFRVFSTALTLPALVLITGCQTNRITVPESPLANGDLLISTKEEQPLWYVNGIEQTNREAAISYKPRAGEYIIAMRERGVETKANIFGIEATENPPEIDGLLGDDWNDPPTGKVITPVGILEFRFLMVPDEFGGGDLYGGFEALGNISEFEVEFEDGIYTWPDPDAEERPIDKSLRRTVEKRFEMPNRFRPSNNPHEMEITVRTPEGKYEWSEHGYVYLLPDPSTLPPGGGRQQLSGGETELKISAEPTKDSSWHTPLPVEKPGLAVHKPDWLDLKCPWEGTYEVSQGFGFEAPGWTHQTIGNKNSANDFFSLDLNMPIGTPILAPADGRVIQSNRRGDSYGNYIVVDHGKGVQTIYAHLHNRTFDVDKGYPELHVKQGDLLGYSGESGTSYPHLHFSVHTGSRASHSGANVGGLTTCPEPLDGYYGIRKGHMLTSTNVQNGS